MKYLMLALAMVGCSVPTAPIDYSQARLRSSHLTIDNQFDAEDQEKIFAAIDIWNARAPNDVSVTYSVGTVSNQELEVVKRPKGFLAAEPKAVGRCCFPAIELDYTYKRLQATMVHELGHMFGLDHSENPESVMFHMNGNLVPTDEDISNLQQRLHEVKPSVIID